MNKKSRNYYNFHYYFLHISFSRSISLILIIPTILSLIHCAVWIWAISSTHMILIILTSTSILHVILVFAHFSLLILRFIMTTAAYGWLFAIAVWVMHLISHWEFSCTSILTRIASSTDIIWALFMHFTTLTLTHFTITNIFIVYCP